MCMCILYNTQTTGKQLSQSIVTANDKANRGAQCENKFNFQSFMQICPASICLFWLLLYHKYTHPPRLTVKCLTEMCLYIPEPTHSKVTYGWTRSPWKPIIASCTRRTILTIGTITSVLSGRPSISRWTRRAGLTDCTLVEV